MSDWEGAGSFSENLDKLRREVAISAAAVPSLMRLTEFYLAEGLDNEALATASLALTGSGPTPETTQLGLEADLARLLQGQPLGASAPLLTNPEQCNRPDLALWRTLEAAALHDNSALVAAAPAALVALQRLPEPMLNQIALWLGDALHGDGTIIAGLLSALRNAKETNSSYVAGRNLLEARLAKTEGDVAMETAWLRRAAQFDGTAAGLAARERLAEVASTRPGPDTQHVEETLADLARVYRDAPIGQRAAAYLAERRLRQGDYRGALAIADESARFDGAPHLDSRGAAIIARVLRMLFVHPPSGSLPSAAERIALFLRYQGYATPGQTGDDIRLGAAKMLLVQGLAASALDVVQELTPSVASTPDGVAVRAIAEARAGNPGTALTLILSAPTSDELQRAAADALVRMGQPAEAAHQLDGLAAMPDRIRRAALLCDARDWGGAASAYADVLHDPTLSDGARHDVQERYDSARALVDDHPAGPTTAPAGGAARATAASPPPAADGGGQATVAATRAALTRAQQIESLLSAAATNQGS